MRFLGFDARDAFRSLRRDRAYAFTTIVTLALTIGATTAAFSIVDGVLLKPLAYPESERLVAVREVWQQLAGRIPTLEVNERHLEYWREHATSFESLAQYIVLPANLTGREDAAQLSVARCSGSIFDVLRVPANLGRTLTADDEPPQAPDVVAISDALWRERFAADPGVIGASIVLDGKPYTVVGVLPPGFRLPGNRLPTSVDAFVPLRLTAGWVGDHNNDAIGRLKPGVTAEQARAELDVLQGQVSTIATNELHEPVTLSSVVTPLAEQMVGSSRRSLLLFLAAVAAVLLIACSNLANLSLTRALGKVRDAAIRASLGASRQRLLTRALIEQVILALAGGAFGVWVAWGALALFVRTAPLDLPRVSEVSLDVRVLTFAAIVSVLAGIFTAVVPAWRLAGRDVQAALRATAASVAADRAGLRAYAALLTMQVALSVTLLIVAALFGASLLRVLNVDRGFSADRVLAVDLAFPASRYADERVRQHAYDRLLAAVQALPGVQGVTTTSMLPLGGQGQVNAVAPEGSTRPMAEQPSANFRFVAPDFFRTLGISLLKGRSFTEGERDPARPAPAVVSEPTAASLWPGENPIGKRFSRGIAGEQGFEVVGVATDARMTSLDRTPPLMVYLPYWWRSRPTTSLLVKTESDRLAILPDLRRVVRGIDPEIAIGGSRPVQQLVNASVAGRRYQARLFLVFAGVALFIALVGVYAATAYGVSRRRREMNLRVALGAQPSQVLRLIVGQGARPVAAGVVAGAVGALALGGVISSLLFEVRARDPVLIASVVAIVGVVALGTCGLVARRGLSIDPSAALREE